jgi:hypothetical protein
VFVNAKASVTGVKCWKLCDPSARAVVASKWAPTKEQSSWQYCSLQRVAENHVLVNSEAANAHRWRRVKTELRCLQLFDLLVLFLVFSDSVFGFDKRHFAAHKIVFREDDVWCEVLDLGSGWVVGRGDEWRVGGEWVGGEWVGGWLSG